MQRTPWRFRVRVKNRWSIVRIFIQEAEICCVNRVDKRVACPRVKWCASCFPVCMRSVYTGLPKFMDYDCIIVVVKSRFPTRTHSMTEQPVHFVVENLWNCSLNTIFTVIFFSSAVSVIYLSSIYYHFFLTIYLKYCALPTSWLCQYFLF